MKHLSVVSTFFLLAFVPSLPLANFKLPSAQPGSFDPPAAVSTAHFKAKDSLKREEAISVDLTVDTLFQSLFIETSAPESIYSFGNPAGCAEIAPDNLSPTEMLANVQTALGNEINLAEIRETYIWNGPLGTMLNVTDDSYVFEFVFNSYKPPLTYMGDRVATIFLENGFTVWFRSYDSNFHLLAVPMVPGVFESDWAPYVSAYWQPGGQPVDDTIYPVIKKLPCHWMIDAGYVSDEQVRQMFSFEWHIPDYLAAGSRYLASDCPQANQIAREQMNMWSASVMCGPLTWTTIRDANGFPYRIGSWSNNASAFIGSNPRWSGQPWSSFDPETFDLISTEKPMSGYNFQKYGDLFPGDIVYSFGTLYVTPGIFDHIFLVAGFDHDGTRLSITNMVPNDSVDCQIREVSLYTPGVHDIGIINHEWNGFSYGKTGTTGFDVFRWKWITYHVNGQSMPYTVRWGDTLQTIAFDWKISPESLQRENQLPPDVSLTAGQVINLPVPQPFEPVLTGTAWNGEPTGY